MKRDIERDRVVAIKQAIRDARAEIGPVKVYGRDARIAGQRKMAAIALQKLGMSPADARDAVSDKVGPVRHLVDAVMEAR